jgi:hypothetical protein
MFQDFDKTHHCCARPTDIQEVKWSEAKLI